MNKLYLIVISNLSDIDVKNIKNLIGLEELINVGGIGFMSAQFIWEGYCVGKLDNNMIIVNPYLVYKFYTRSISDFEHTFCKLLPNSGIAILSLYSVINSYGFAIIDKGKRVRVKYAGDEQVYFDFGEKLKEEIEVEKMGLGDDYSNGSRVVYRLFERYFGKDEKEVFNSLNSFELNEYK